MARRSPPVVNQTCETGCTWRMFGIFNFREGPFKRRSVSLGRLLNAHATGNQSSSLSSDALNKVDGKYPQIVVNSRRRRRRDYGCKSISCVENDQVAADQGNNATKLTIDQKLVSTNYLGKEGASCQPEQILDALQILYSNKELFLKLLQDPNSLLVKQIHDSQSSECGKLFKSSDRYDSNLSSEPQFSDRIVVLKPSINCAGKFSDTRFHSPGSHSARRFSNNTKNIKPSNFPHCRIKRKFRYSRVRRTEQQWRKKTDGVPDKFPCGCQGSEDGKNVEDLERIEKKLNSTLDLKKDSELCIGKEVASLGESCGGITYNASEQNRMNLHVEDRRSQSDMMKCGIEEFKQRTNSPRRTVPVPGNRLNHRTKLGLQKEDENGLFSSSVIDKDSPTQSFNKNNSTGGIEPFQDSHPETQIVSFSPEVVSTSPSSCDSTSTESVADHFTEENVINPPVTTSQPDESPPVQVVLETIEENHFADLMRSSLDDATKNLAFSKETLDNLREILQALSLKWDELVAKCESSDHLHDPSTFDELTRSTSRLSGNTNTVVLDCAIETFMEVYQNYCGTFALHIATRSPSVQAYRAKKVLVKEITELMNSHFSPHPTEITLDLIVGKDLARNGSWLNIGVDAEDIVMEVEEDVLDDLVLEMISEMDMDIRSIIHCKL